jgi:hypothetical protein
MRSGSNESKGGKSIANSRVGGAHARTGPTARSLLFFPLTPTRWLRYLRSSGAARGSRAPIWWGGRGKTSSACERVRVLPLLASACEFYPSLPCSCQATKTSQRGIHCSKSAHSMSYSVAKRVTNSMGGGGGITFFGVFPLDLPFPEVAAAACVAIASSTSIAAISVADADVDADAGTDTTTGSATGIGAGLVVSNHVVTCAASPPCRAVAVVTCVGDSTSAIESIGVTT